MPKMFRWSKIPVADIRSLQAAVLLEATGTRLLEYALVFDRGRKQQAHPPTVAFEHVLVPHIGRRRDVWASFGAAEKAAVAKGKNFGACGAQKYKEKNSAPAAHKST